MKITIHFTEELNNNSLLRKKILENLLFLAGVAEYNRELLETNNVLELDNIKDDTNSEYLIEVLQMLPSIKEFKIDGASYIHIL